MLHMEHAHDGIADGTIGSREGALPEARCAPRCTRPGMDLPMAAPLKGRSMEACSMAAPFPAIFLPWTEDMGGAPRAPPWRPVSRRRLFPGTEPGNPQGRLRSHEGTLRRKTPTSPGRSPAGTWRQGRQGTGNARFGRFEG
jgi:hypothetical protein